MPRRPDPSEPRLRLRLAMLACLCAGLCGCSDGAIVSTTAKLQRAPASDSEVLAAIPKGSTVTVRDCSNGWCRVSWNGRDGYLLTKAVRIGKAARRATADKSGDDSADDDNLAAPDAMR